MNIAFFTDSFLPGIGGTENVVMQLAKEYSKIHNVMVLAPSYHREYDDKSLPFKVVRTNSIGVSKNDFWALPQLTPKVKKALDEFKPDVIHAHTIGMMLGYAISYGKKKCIPVISTIHTKYRYFYIDSVGSEFIADMVINHVMKRPDKADRITAVSVNLEKELRSYGVKNPITIVRNGKDTVHYNIEKQVNKDKFTLLFVGMVCDHKNIGFSFEVLSELKKRRNDFVFKLVGLGQIDKFKKKAKKMGIEDNVEFAGAVRNREELYKYYKNSDLFLFTSIADSDGLVVLEAADMDTPSLVMDDMGASERIVDGETGFIAEHNVKAMADKIEYLMNNRDILISVGKNARRIYKPWEEIARDYMNVYMEEIEKKKSSQSKK